MRVLAVDTTTSRESVAVVAGGRLLGEVRLDAPTPSRRLMPAIAFLLESLQLGPRDVEGYALTVGPGSFTGLRIGISTVQGLALAGARPCLGLSSLDVLAARIAGSAPCLAAMVATSRGEVFARVFDAEARPLGPPFAGPPAGFLSALGPGTALVGDGAEAHRALVERSVAGCSFPARTTFLAGTVGRLAEPRLAAGEGVAAGALRPLYLREAHIRGPQARA